MADSVDHTTDSTDWARFRAAYRSWCKMDSVNCARFRVANRAHHIVKAVCRSWCAVVLEHLPCPPRRLPWILEGHYYYVKSSDTWGRRLPSLPENAMCIGCTDDWIAVCCVFGDNAHKTHSYLLHNPFSETTMPIPELDALIGNNVSVLFEIRKVLMRSTPHDVVAIMTNNYNYPIILVRPGKGMWLPRPRAAPFIYIIDIAFIGDTLYGITNGEDLLCLDIAKRVIRHPFKVGDHSKVWSNTDLFRVWSYPYKLDDGYDLWRDVDEKYHKYVAKDKDGQDGETLNGGHDEDRAQYKMSRGKLLMLRRKLHRPPRCDDYTSSADVFEANITTGTWVPVKDGLHGQALFISRYYSKSIHASGEIEKDAVYFADTGEVLNMRSRIISKPQRDVLLTLAKYSTWLFPPEPQLSDY
uniref:KIB1-4 beta-propeller domain-containing protein n=1 Tax=Aegilops tauschii TaxID=37682 RepID=R7W1H1_AEGTA